MSMMQFEDAPPKVGDEIEVSIEGYDQSNGLLILSRKFGAVQSANWSTIAEGMVVEAKVTGTNKGGLNVEVNGKTVLQDPKNGASRAAQANTMQSMDVIDPVTLKLTLKAKNAVFPQTVALIPYIGSPKAIQEKGANFANDPVGAGPSPKTWPKCASHRAQTMPSSKSIRAASLDDFEPARSRSRARARSRRFRT